MSQSYDPKKLGRILRLAMEEVLGEKEMHSVFEASRMPAEEESKPLVTSVQEPSLAAPEVMKPRQELALPGVAQVLMTLEQVYGTHAGRGLALRIGRACFQYGLREYGTASGITTTSFRLLPFPSKLSHFAAALARLFQSTTGHEVRVEERDGKLLWHMEHCPFCRDRQAEVPICSLPAGLAEEALYWLSGGKMFSVEEAACIARGDPACVMQVDETPLS